MIPQIWIWKSSEPPPVVCGSVHLEDLTPAPGGMGQVWGCKYVVLTFCLATKNMLYYYIYLYIWDNSTIVMLLQPFCREWD